MFLRLLLILGLAAMTAGTGAAADPSAVTFYWFRTPVALPVTTWIGLTAAWDNSEGNPRNPNKPPRDVHWGERSVDEMGHAAILYTYDDETSK